MANAHRMRIPKATNTHSYLMLIAFARQQWLRERASMLLYTQTARLASLAWRSRLTLVPVKSTIQ